MEIIRYPNSKKSLASFRPLSRLKLTTLFQFEKERIVKHVKMPAYHNYGFYNFSSLGNGHSLNPWNILHI